MTHRSVVKFALSTVFAVGSVAAAPIEFSVAGANPAGIQATVDAFRTALGALNANVVGSFGSGRREINWDGVPNGVSAPNNLPADFFNVNSPRGVVFSTPGTGFQTSANAGIDAIEFGNLNAGYPAEFQVFSAQRLFTPLGSTITDINFFIAGSATAAGTPGFGAVFTDVDLASTTSLEFFGATGLSLGTYFAPAAGGGLSFLGVRFDSGQQIGRVRVTTGNAAMGPADGAGTDVVAMDDFIYGEPSPVPEPATVLLFGAGLFAIGLVRRAQKRTGPLQARNPYASSRVK